MLHRTFIITLLALLAFMNLAQGDELPRPAFTEGTPAAGQFVRQAATGAFLGSAIYHGLYLPTNWQPGEKYPVVVEYAPNRAEQFGTTGRVEDCRLGYYWTGGRDFIWLVLPYIDVASRTNQDTWWGHADVSCDYALSVMAQVCDDYGGDRDTIILCGFSRGAIACGYLGLRNDAIADVWLGFWAHSHIDGGKFTPAGAAERLARVRGRKTLVTWGETDGAKSESPRGAERLREAGQPVEAFEIAGEGHSDRWIEKDCAARQSARAWLAEVLQKRPGTFHIRGQVVDPTGKPVAGATVTYGSWHRAVTDATGQYEVRGLTSGTRSLVVERRDFQDSKGYEVKIIDENVTATSITLQQERTGR